MLHRHYVRALLAASPAWLFAALYAQPWYRDGHRRWLDEIPVKADEHVLEVGCGPGLLTRELGARGCNATGVDRSPRMLRYARRRSASAENVVFHRAAAQALPFADGTFDVALAASLINIADDPPAVARELARVTRGGGRVSLLVPGRAMSRESAEAYIAAHRLNGLGAELLRTWASYAPKSDAADLIALLREAGLGRPAVRDYLDGQLLAATVENPG